MTPREVGLKNLLKCLLERSLGWPSLTLGFFTLSANLSMSKDAVAERI